MAVVSGKFQMNRITYLQYSTVVISCFFRFKDLLFGSRRFLGDIINCKYIFTIYVLQGPLTITHFKIIGNERLRNEIKASLYFRTYIIQCVRINETLKEDKEAYLVVQVCSAQKMGDQSSITIVSKKIKQLSHDQLNAVIATLSGLAYS